MDSNYDDELHDKPEDIYASIDPECPECNFWATDENKNIYLNKRAEIADDGSIKGFLELPKHDSWEDIVPYWNCCTGEEVELQGPVLFCVVWEGWSLSPLIGGTNIDTGMVEAQLATGAPDIIITSEAEENYTINNHESITDTKYIGPAFSILAEIAYHGCMEQKVYNIDHVLNVADLVVSQSNNDDTELHIETTQVDPDGIPNVITGGDATKQVRYIPVRYSEFFIDYGDGKSASYDVYKPLFWGFIEDTEMDSAQELADDGLINTDFLDNGSTISDDRFV